MWPLLLVACAGAQPAPGTPEPLPSEAAARALELAPPPFTAEQIRDATKPGRTYVFQLELPEQAPVKRRIRFVAADDTGCTMETAVLDASGKPQGEPRRSEITWSALVAHAAYPKAATTIEDASIEVPAGMFETLRYTVVDGGQTTVAHFAKSLPGAPVSHRVEKDGELVSAMTLVEHREGE